MKESNCPELIWEEEHRILTLEGQPVLEYDLRWPRLNNAKGDSRRINRYYSRLARQWQLRWQREVYWQACLDLAQKLAESRPFIPWAGSLTGEMTLWESGLLSLSLTGEERRGSKKICRVRWGDTWQVKEGAPCPPSHFFQKKAKWKNELLSQLIEEGQAMVKSGEHFFDSDWEARLPRWLNQAQVWLTENRMEWAFPPCAISPSAEGVPLFSLPREKPLQNGETRQNQPSKKKLKKLKITP